MDAGSFSSSLNFNYLPSIQLSKRPISWASGELVHLYFFGLCVYILLRFTHFTSRHFTASGHLVLISFILTERFHTLHTLCGNTCWVDASDSSFMQLYRFFDTLFQTQWPYHIFWKVVLLHFFCDLFSLQHFALKRGTRPAYLNGWDRERAIALQVSHKITFTLTHKYCYYSRLTIFP